MKHSHLAIFAFLASATTFSTPAFCADCSNAASTPEIEQCAKKDQEKAEAKLNDTYKKAMAALSAQGPDPKAKSSLASAQRLWIKFREADCQAVYDYHEGGTIRGLEYIGCMRARATAREAEIRATYLDER